MISINATLIVQVINFLILMWVLNRVMFQPIFKIIEERENTIMHAKNEMARLKSEAERKAESIEAQMRQARKKAAAEKDDIVGQASKDADAVFNQALAKAQEHLTTVHRRAEDQAKEVRKSLDDYKGAIVKMVFAKVLGRENT